MTPFPTSINQDAVDILVGAITGRLPFVSGQTEQAAWDLVGYGLGQASGQIDWSAPVIDDPEGVARVLTSKAPIPWATLVPQLVSLFLGTFFPTKSKPPAKRKL